MYVAALGRMLDQAPRSGAGGVALALVLTGAALLGRLAVEPIAPQTVPFALFYVSTLLVALLAGPMPSAVAVAAAAASAWLFLLPEHDSWALTPDAAVNLVLFVATQAAVVAMALALRGTVQRLRAAQATLQGNEALLRAVFAQLPAAAFVVEAETRRVTLRSARTAQILPAEDPLEVPLFGADGAALPRAAHPALRALHQGEAVDGEPARLRAAEGWRDLELFARPVRGPDGRIVAAACTAFDVTARQQAEDAWHAKAAELEGLMSLAPVGVWFSYDPEVKRVERNRFAAELFAVPEGSTAPLGADRPGGLAHIELRQDGQRVPTDRLPLQRAFRGEESRDEEYEAVFADGSRKVLLSNARPLRDAAGRIVGAVSASLDITARKRTEAELHEAVRARELLQREADHRIKNSLQLVAAMLRLQQSRLKDPAAAAPLDAAIARIAAVAEVHGALQGSPDLRMVEVAAMLSDISRFVAKLNPEVEVTCAAEGRTRLDAQRAIPLGLVVAELLTNAVRHAYPDGARGRVEVRVTCGEGELSVEVSDDGIGMEGRPRPGSLGTMLVQSLAQKIGAAVETQSAPGQGTRVTVRLSDTGQSAGAGGANPAVEQRPGS